MVTDKVETSQKVNTQVITVQWRRHEIILATATAIMLAAGYILNIYKTPVTSFADAFINNHVPFNLYKNVVVPAMGTSLLGYLAYLWINLYTIPRLLLNTKVAGTSGVSFKKIALQELAKNVTQKYLPIVLQVILIIALLGTAFNMSVYFQHQWQFSYPGFSIFFNKNIVQSQIDIGGGYFSMAAIVLAYAAYAAVRETFICLIDTSGQQQVQV